MSHVAGVSVAYVCEDTTHAETGRQMQDYRMELAVQSAG